MKVEAISYLMLCFGGIFFLFQVRLKFGINRLYQLHVILY